MTTDQPDRIDVVFPCLDEAAALPDVLRRVPPGFRAIVVDNGSVDASAEVASRHGARVVFEGRRGYGAAVHAGLLAATADIVAVMDADGSVDPGQLTDLVADVAAGTADLAVGRRRPVPGSWPRHARAGNALLAARLRAATGFDVHDGAPVRVARREPLLALHIEDRRSGYPVEMLLRAAAAGWTLTEHDLVYRARHAGTRSKVSGTVRGTLTAVGDISKVLRHLGRETVPVSGRAS